MNMLKAVGVAKSYGRVKALDNLNLELQTGGITGLLGPNGSGKTTLLKILAGFLKMDGGMVQIGGVPLGPETKGMVSYLPDRNHLFPWMNVQDAINYYADFFPDFDAKRAKTVITDFGLHEKAAVKTLSKGELEKLTLTLTLSRQAKLFLLDEPLGGMDPLARDGVIDMILSTFREDSTILVTTHLVGEIERLFDSVAFIGQGSISVQGNAEALREERGMSVDRLYREVFKNEKTA